MGFSKASAEFYYVRKRSQKPLKKITKTNEIV